MSNHETRSPLVRMRGVTKRYRSGDEYVLALDDVELDVEQGEFVAVLGPSGCGKSTLLSVLGLLEGGSSGEYRLSGIDMRDLDFDQRCGLRNRSIGLVFQAFNLIADLTVAENVALPLRYSDIPKKDHDPRVRSLLSRVGLDKRTSHYPHQLSGGQQQRVAIARAMVTGPALVLADEPTGNLDSGHAGDVVDLLGELNSEGATIIMVTHDRAIGAMATRQVHMADGRVVGVHR